MIEELKKERQVPPQPIFGNGGPKMTDGWLSNNKSGKKDVMLSLLQKGQDHAVHFKETPIAWPIAD